MSFFGSLFGGGSTQEVDDYNMSTTDCVNLAKQHGIETSLNTISWLINNGTVEAKKFSSVWVVSRSSFMKWLDKKVAENS